MKRKTVKRLALLGVLMVSLALVAKFTPLGDYLTYAFLSERLKDAGYIGILIYVAAFIAGALMNLPAFVFTGVAFLVYGMEAGYAVAFVGSFFSAFVHFEVVRTIGGKALTEVKIPLMQKILGKFDKHPLLAVILLRTVFFISPPVNYLLALSNFRTRHIIIGTLVGNIFPLCLHAGLLYFTRDWVLKTIS